MLLLVVVVVVDTAFKTFRDAVVAGTGLCKNDLTAVDVLSNNIYI